jgi:hypothetical protein
MRRFLGNFCDGIVNNDVRVDRIERTHLSHIGQDGDVRVGVGLEVPGDVVLRGIERRVASDVDGIGGLVYLIARSLVSSHRRNVITSLTRT